MKSPSSPGLIQPQLIQTSLEYLVIRDPYLMELMAVRLGGMDWIYRSALDERSIKR